MRTEVLDIVNEFMSDGRWGVLVMFELDEVAVVADVPHLHGRLIYLHLEMKPGMATNGPQPRR